MSTEMPTPAVSIISAATQLSLLSNLTYLSRSLWLLSLEALGQDRQGWPNLGRAIAKTNRLCSPLKIYERVTFFRGENPIRLSHEVIVTSQY